MRPTGLLYGHALPTDFLDALGRDLDGDRLVLFADELGGPLRFERAVFAHLREKARQGSRISLGASKPRSARVRREDALLTMPSSCCTHLVKHWKREGKALRSVPPRQTAS